jgi:hypothetical protein
MVITKLITVVKSAERTVRNVPPILVKFVKRVKFYQKANVSIDVKRDGLKETESATNVLPLIAMSVTPSTSILAIFVLRDMSSRVLNVLSIAVITSAPCSSIPLDTVRNASTIVRDVQMKRAAMSVLKATTRRLINVFLNAVKVMSLSVIHVKNVSTPTVKPVKRIR